jgi:hypothetical protein
MFELSVAWWSTTNNSVSSCYPLLVRDGENGPAEYNVGRLRLCHSSRSIATSTVIVISCIVSPPICIVVTDGALIALEYAR